MFMIPPCYNAGDTIYFGFPSFDSNGGSVTITGLAVTDIEPQRMSDEVERASDNGYTLLDTDGIDLKGRAGIHGFKIGGRGDRTSRLNDVYTQTRELLGHFHFFFQVHAAPGRLLAVAQRCIEDNHLIRIHDSCLSWEAGETRAALRS